MRTEELTAARALGLVGESRVTLDTVLVVVDSFGLLGQRRRLADSSQYGGWGSETRVPVCLGFGGSPFPG